MNTPKPRPPAPRPAYVPMWSLTRHASEQAVAKGFGVDAVLNAARSPQITYESMRVPGQYRHVSGRIVAVVDPVDRRVITVYENVTETDVRPDQTDADALAYGRGRSGL